MEMQHADASLPGQLQPNLSCLADNPGDVQALAALRAIFANCVASDDRGLAQLARSAVYLLERLADGTVAANHDSTALLADAGSALAQTPPLGYLELVERLDVYASGLGVVAADADAATATHEPPLLVVREDGSRVVPGAFGVATNAEPPPAAVPDGSSPVAVSVALNAASERLQTQLGTLDLLAGAELKRLAADLAATAKDIERLQQALASWVRQNAAST